MPCKTDTCRSFICCVPWRLCGNFEMNAACRFWTQLDAIEKECLHIKLFLISACIKAVLNTVLLLSLRNFCTLAIVQIHNIRELFGHGYFHFYVKDLLIDRDCAFIENNSSLGPFSVVQSAVGLLRGALSEPQINKTRKLMEWREINRFSSFTAGCWICRLDAVARAYLSAEFLKCSPIPRPVMAFKSS